MGKKSKLSKEKKWLFVFQVIQVMECSLQERSFPTLLLYFGNDLSTFPDYPAEIRAPQGTVGGVSGFQVHLGHSEINTPGDFSDVLVAMNPAAIKANAKWIKPGGTVIYDEGNFTEKNIEKAGYLKKIQ